MTRDLVFFVNLRDGPVVVELPPVDDAALSGTLVNAWNVPMIDSGAVDFAVSRSHTSEKSVLTRTSTWMLDDLERVP